MLIVIGAVLLALFVIPSPWGYPLIAVAVALMVWQSLLERATRRLPPVTGVESMIGGRAVVVSHCRPTGRVRYDGQSWPARSTDGAEAGETVTIVSVERATLLVRRDERDAD